MKQIIRYSSQVAHAFAIVALGLAFPSPASVLAIATLGVASALIIEAALQSANPSHSWMAESLATREQAAATAAETKRKVA